MFWKSTAILVQTTSIPTTGLGARPVQASADRMSEAVKSAGLSGGAVVMADAASPQFSRRSLTLYRPLGVTRVHGVEHSLLDFSD